MTRTLIALAALLAAAPALAAKAPPSAWVVDKDEADPFDKTHRTFIARTGFAGSNMLVLRCLEGEESLLVIFGSGGEQPGLTGKVTLAVDGKDERPDSDATIISANTVTAAAQFATDDHAFLDALKGAATFHLRLEAGSRSGVFTFSAAGLDAILDRAAKACGAN